MLNLGALAAGTVGVSATARDTHEIVRSFLDTLAVAHAGRAEPVVVALRQCYGEQPAASEHRALCMATCAHALDFDDVQFSSLAHVSSVVIPALLSVMDSASTVNQAQDLASGYLAGVNVARWVGTALGSEHYRAGWHATSTIGPLAVAAAVGRYGRLSPDQTAHAIALATCQASGTQRSFGAMAKPLHAGFASCAGVRAAQLARLGVTGPQNPFSGAGGFETLYAGRAQVQDAMDMSALTLDLARKAYPCCYGAQRLVSACLDLRSRLTSVKPDRLQGIVVTAQTGTLIPLRVKEPYDGNAAKFCADYLMAVALLDGCIRLAHFTPNHLGRADIAALRQKISVVQVGPVAASIEDGTVQACCTLQDGTTVQSRCVAYFPGSPQAPLSDAQLDDKLLDCFGGDKDAVARTRTQVRRWLGVSTD